MNEEHILTPHEFIVRWVNKYPTLFASHSYDETRFRILDHVLNTIGNGRAEDFIGAPVTDDEIATAEKFFNCNSLSTGYVYKGGPWLCVVCSQDRASYPQVKHWTSFKCNSRSIPQPYFEKEYSTVWGARDVQFETLGSEWVDAASWFYTECLKFFTDRERVVAYKDHLAFRSPSESRGLGWRKERTRILTFILETLSHLKKMNPKH